MRRVGARPFRGGRRRGPSNGNGRASGSLCGDRSRRQNALVLRPLRRAAAGAFGLMGERPVRADSPRWLHLRSRRGRRQGRRDGPHPGAPPLYRGARPTTVQTEVPDRGRRRSRQSEPGPVRPREPGAARRRRLHLGRFDEGRCRATDDLLRHKRHGLRRTAG